MAYLATEGVDLSLSFVQASGELAVLLVAQMKLALHPLQLQTQRLTLRLSHQQDPTNHPKQIIFPVTLIAKSERTVSPVTGEPDCCSLTSRDFSAA